MRPLNMRFSLCDKKKVPQKFQIAVLDFAPETKIVRDKIDNNFMEKK